MDPNIKYGDIPVGLIIVGSIAKTKTYRYQRRNPDTGKYEKGPGTLKQNYPSSFGAESEAKTANRQRFANAMAAWKALSEEEKQTYGDRADEIRRNHPNPLDKKRWLLGHNLFISEYE